MVGITSLALLTLSAAPFLSTVTAHPGEHLSSLQIKRQVAKNEYLAARGAAKMARCADSLKARALRKRAIDRRAAKFDTLKRRALMKRSATEVEAYDVSHNYTGSVSEGDDVFSTNASCILEPQMTVGPYYVRGELIRSDPVEDQEGVGMDLELQFIDVNTCEPVPGLYIDVWNANSTGVYSGVAASSLQTTYLRAIQISDDDGLVEFQTLVPGHYDGRASHTHLMVHQDVTAYSNGTYGGGTARSISQLFYDTELRAAVESVAPYNTNTNSITTNEEDSILSAVTLDTYDPFVKYAYLGESISDGIFAWHSIGIDLTANYTAEDSAAAWWTAEGGIDESSTDSVGSPGGSGGPGGNNTGSFSGAGGPSGAAPSGGVSSGVASSGFATSVVAAVTSSTASSGTTSRSSSTTASSHAASTAVGSKGTSTSKTTSSTKAGSYGGKDTSSAVHTSSQEAATHSSHGTQHSSQEAATYGSHNDQYTSQSAAAQSSHTSQAAAGHSMVCSYV